MPAAPGAGAARAGRAPARGAAARDAPARFRTIVGVGPGTRPAGPALADRHGSGATVRLRASVPAQPPRPMHPPIARVMASPRRRRRRSRRRGRRPRRPARRPAGAASPPARRTRARRPGPALGFGMPSLRRNVCPHFFMSGARGAIPIQAPHLLKALVRQETNVSRCQLRGGVHLEQGYVNDVCLSARFNQCVFYEDELSR